VRPRSSNGPPAPADDVTLPVLMALRVKGRAPAAVVSAVSGIPESDVRRSLDAAGARGAVAGVPPDEAYRLTDAGRDELTVLLASERVDRARLAALYDGFLSADAALKEAVSAWQLGGRASRQLPAVGAAGAAARALVGRLVEAAPRLAPYACRLDLALAALGAGDERFVASPGVDSLHQVWFELHEDLLVTLGRPRAS
jgi:pyruvate,orthophosphate dikinase